MKKAISAVIIIAVSLFGFWAVSGRPVYMAVLDSPIDFHHTEISAILDEELLQNISIKDQNGQERTWYELNEAARAEFERRLDQGQYQDQVKFLDALNRPISEKGRGARASMALKVALAGMVKYILSPKFRSGLKVVGNYLHGTHVAGIMVRSLTNVRLISFPLLTVNRELRPSDIIKFDPESQRKEARALLDNISQVLKANNVRVVNMSVATSEKIAFKSFSQRASFLDRIVLRPWIKNLATQTSQLFIEEVDRLIQDNPQTVFVLAAGNEKLNLSDSRGHTSHLVRPNLIKVAALDRNGAVASFSNKSSEFIDIAALGTGVSSALINGGRVHLSGTSQAAPAVANAVAQIFEKKPSLTAEQAIGLLFKKNSNSIDELKEWVAQGRVLAKTPSSSKAKKRNNAGKKEVLIDVEFLSQDEISALVRANTLDLLSGKVSEVELRFLLDGELRAIQKLVLDERGDVELTTLDPKVGCSSYLEDLK